MTGKPRMRAGLALGLLLVLALPGQRALAQPVHAHEAAAGLGSAAPGFQKDMDVGMARMMQDMHAPGYSANPDVDFLAMMIPHHAGAVEMARLVLNHGRDPATRQLAQEIIASQTSEIESMNRRLTALRQSASGRRTPEFPALGGTRGD